MSEKVYVQPVRRNRLPNTEGTLSTVLTPAIIRSANEHVQQEAAAESVKKKR